MAKFGEHVDDHQLQLLDEFEKMQIIVACYDTDKLEDAYRLVQTKKLKKYKSNQKRIIDSIEEFLTGI